jgi:hypothetical protein
MAGNPTPARWPVFSLLTQWLTEPRGKTSNDIAALAGLSGEEAARIRAHLRASPEDLRWLAGRDPGHAELLPHMLSATGIDPTKIPAETGEELARCCGACQDKPHCAEELARGAAAQNFPDFCPNAERLKTLRDTNDG